jgi:hypothetical protein
MADRSSNNISPPHRDRDGVRRKAENHFVAAERRDSQVKQEIEAERIASETKTAKLRALRLAKEEEERIAAEAGPQAPAKVRKAKTVRIWV